MTIENLVPSLLSEPYITLDSNLVLPVRMSGSTAGPPPGEQGALFLRIDGRLVRVNVTTSADFSLGIGDEAKGPEDPTNYHLKYHGELIPSKVELVEPLLHAPDMAFLNLYSGCDYSCAFCTQPTNKNAQIRSVREIIDLINKAQAIGELKSISLTSGICSNPNVTTQGMVWALMALRQTFPEMALGVEPYLEEPSGIAKLKEAGANEIKLNLQVATPELLAKVCPEMEWEQIWENLAEAVKVFGKGKVQSNLLVGFGETQEEVSSTMEQLVSQGVLPSVRQVRLVSGQQERLEHVLEHTLPEPSPEYLVGLLDIQSRLLKEYGMEDRANEASSMCQVCGACDLMPRFDS